jgi:uncharacterized protein YecE (DUF72 family)
VSRALVVNDGGGGALVAHPNTGELIDPRAMATTDLAEVRARVTEVRERWVEVLDVIDEVLRDRLDHEGRRSATVGDWKLKVPAPTRVEVDGPRLYLALAQLVGEGEISQAKADATVARRYEYKVNRTELKALERHVSPAVREAVNACLGEVPQSRRVQVSAT